MKMQNPSIITSILAFSTVITTLLKRPQMRFGINWNVQNGETNAMKRQKQIGRKGNHRLTHNGIIAGKLKGQIPAQTPRGSLML